jgi:predicted ATPase/class 3 adenylate cyclase
LAAQTLTFLFTDVEGSTALLTRLGGGYAEVLADHHRLIRASLAAHGGEEVDTQGDAFFAVFSSPSACAAAAIDMQRAFLSHPWPAGEGVRVRMGLHSGEASQTTAGLVGLGIHRAARIAAAGYGGQIVLSAATAALLGDSMPVGASLRDLGLHRLKDLERPERIFQLEADGLTAGFPPLRSLDNPNLRNNLPAQASSFVGRDAELSRVQALIASSRLVTLTGSGGAGKTRLGLQLAAGLVDGSGDGVWFADLAPLQDPDLVAVTVANVLGIRGEPGRPLVDTLVDAIGRRRLLVLLDNCEHVIDACAKLADALLRNCPNVALLATSREPLGIGGERVHRVPSMDTPGEDDVVEAIGGSEAVRLFAERAAQHGVPLAWDERTALVVGRICRRLDGIPLAIELAAARLSVMSATELDARLDQRFSLLTGGSRTALPRQQTLRAAVEWSWELLNAAERHMLARLSVFAGGFDLPAAEAVTAGDAPAADEAVAHLAALVDKNLVQFDDIGTGRYRLLETVRQYAAQQLEGSPAAAHGTRIAHRDYYLALAESVAHELIAHHQAEWLDRLERELDNLRAAIAFSLKQPDPIPGIRLVTSLRVFWKARGHAAEGADALRMFLAATAAHGATLVRARALAAAAYLLRGGRRGRSRGRRARRCRIAPALPPGRGPAPGGTMAGNLGYAELSLGDLDSARRHLLESLDIARALNDQYGVVYETFNLGLAEYLNSSLSAAEALFAESLDLAARMRMTASTAYALIGLAIADNGGSRPGRSARLHGAADQVLAVLGETLEPLEKGLCDLDRRRLRSAMGTEAFEAEYATGTSLTADEVLALAIGNQD